MIEFTKSENYSKHNLKGFRNNTKGFLFLKLTLIANKAVSPLILREPSLIQ